MPIGAIPLNIPSKKLRVFLADDHTMIRAGLKSLIETDLAMTVVGEAADGEDAVARVLTLKPDVLVLDISMPKLNGVGVASRLRQECPGLKILALSVHEDRGYLRELLEAGVSGYALKRSAADELQRAIRVVARGELYVDPGITREMVNTFLQPKQGDTPAHGLSEREAKVIRLVAEGHSTKEISARLDISVKTVETYKSRSMEKLGLKSRVDIVAYAKQAGWFHPQGEM